MLVEIEGIRNGCADRLTLAEDKGDRLRSTERGHPDSRQPGREVSRVTHAPRERDATISSGIEA